MSDIVLENDRLKAVFDDQTGALINLTNKATGWLIQRRPRLCESFTMLAPLPGRRNNPIRGTRQPPPGVQHAPADKRVVFTWNQLESELGGKLAIAFKGIVTLADEGLVFTAEIDNQSAVTVEAVGWPCLEDLSRPEKSDRFKYQYMCLGSGLSATSLFPDFHSAGYWGVDYPQHVVSSHLTPFIMISDDREGLYVGYHDLTQEQNIQFQFGWEPGYEVVENPHQGYILAADQADGREVRLKFSVQHLPFAGARERMKLHPIVMQPYQGTWHKGVDCYKRWRKTWFQPPPGKPVWTNRVHAWQQIHINSPEDELRCRYADLVRYGRDCQKHGVQAIQLVGWRKGGQDRDDPSHDTDPRLGSWEELQAAIAAIQALGVKVVLFNKYTWADQSSEWFHKELVRYATKDPYGNYHVTSGYNYQTITQLADINLRRLIPLCHQCAVWREIAGREFRKSLALGADGILYDEGHHHGNAIYCFDAEHGHRVPANVYAGDALLADDFQRISRPVKPDYLYAVEAGYDLELRHYHLIYFRIGIGHAPISRYIDPACEMMVAVTALNDRSTINQALLYRYILSYEPRNFKGRLDEFPRTLAYGKLMDDLRRRYSACLWDADYQHTDGAAVKADGQMLTDAPILMRERKYGFFHSRASGKKAVVVVNLNREKACRIQAEIEGQTGALVQVSPERPDPVAYGGGELDLPPLSAVVLMEA